MSQVWSEINKIVNALIPATQTAADHTTDLINMENYKKCTFIIQTGASVANTPNITVLSGTSSTSCATATAFKYRTQIASTGAETLPGGDIPSALTDATTAGFRISSSEEGGMYIIEVDAPTVCAATTGTTYYDHIALKLTDHSTGLTTTQDYGILAVLSEPRYPQAILQTAID